MQSVIWCTCLNMNTAKHHWDILQVLGTDLANRVREFMVTGWDGSGAIVVTEDGLGFWFGKIRFGYEFEMQLGIEPTPLNIPGHIVQMAQSDGHILVLNKLGQLYTIGLNDCGQLGLGTVEEERDETHFSPQLIPNSQKFISVRCGHSHSVALTEDGKVWSWGRNDSGQVGMSVSTANPNHPSPHRISYLNPHRIVAVECGAFHSLALTDQGEVYAWGKNNYGQLGNKTELSSHYIPTRIATHNPVRSIAAGHNHTLLLTQSGEVYACGDNGSGQLGVPTSTIDFNSSLVKVGGLPFISKITSHPATNLSVAMSSNQRCFVWGELNNGKLENEEYYLTMPTPRELPSVYSTVESPLSSFSLQRSTPHSVSVPEIPSNQMTIRMFRMFSLLTNPETSSDVQFVVEQRTIHAHRCILSNSSDYFARMFSERWLPQIDPVNPIVKVTIPDVSYEAFQAFLRFLYTGCLEVDPDLLPELFELASQYLESNLQKLCIRRMRATLSTANCCLYYPLTQRHSLPELDDFRKELVYLASYRMSEVVDSAAYQSMEPDLRDNLANAIQNFSDTS